VISALWTLGMCSVLCALVCWYTVSAPHRKGEDLVEGLVIAVSLCLSVLFGCAWSVLVVIHWGLS